jgi:vitamin B12/bleomycin/antimicrobial peptide transport system ATP-binding/permease protein
MAATKDLEASKRKYLLRRFWLAARGFWTRRSESRAWFWTIGLLVIVVLQVSVQYLINVWNRSIFDALEQKNSAEVLYQAMIFFPLALASIVLAVAIVFTRMTTQRRWRRWLTNYTVDRWLTNGRYFHLNLVSGNHDNPEYRIAEDVRIATESPIGFGAGIVSALLSAITFVGVLWFVGGSITFPLGGSIVTIPAYLVIAAVLYAVFASATMAIIGRRYVLASESKAQSEAELRYVMTRLRENGESIALIAGEEEEKVGLTEALSKVLIRWRELMRQYMRTTVVAQTSFLIAPVFPVILSAPKFLAGTMTLGQVMQAASAFVIVQTAFNWLVDNYPSFADWAASARRVASLHVSLDGLQKAEQAGAWGRIERGDASEGTALELRYVSVTLDDGTAMVKDADVRIAPGEKVLVVGDSGSGKSTLVRAIAGLWPWGSGKILVQPNANMFLMPQRPYIPLGALRRVVIYPKAAEEVTDDEVKSALEAVGLGELKGRTDEEAPWDQTLSGGEKQRIAFARLLIHKPNIIVMDEATSALDKNSQELLMQLIQERLPDTTVLSVGHRPELELFHERKIVLEVKPGGSRIISDEDLPLQRRRRFGFRIPWPSRRRVLPPLIVPERHPGDRLSRPESGTGA